MMNLFALRAGDVSFIDADRGLTNLTDAPLLLRFEFSGFENRIPSRQSDSGFAFRAAELAAGTILREPDRCAAFTSDDRAHELNVTGTGFKTR